MLKKIVEAKDQNDYNSSKKENLVWVPLRDDCIENILSEYGKAKRQITVRAGNRIVLTLDEPGAYQVTIPNDAGRDVEIFAGDISYDTYIGIVRTKIEAHGTTITAGSTKKKPKNGDNKVKYTYKEGCCAFEFYPVTKLITKKGHIDLDHGYK